jgi:hypothetical protein
LIHFDRGRTDRRAAVHGAISAEVVLDAKTCWDPDMKRTCVIGLLVGLFAMGIAGAAPAKTSLETARGQALALHRSLINDAKPQVRAKISAAARAAREYLVRTPRDCDLYRFCSQDLRTRFPRITGQQLQVLMVLVFAETMSDMTQMDNVDLQDKLQKQQQFVQTISNIMKNEHDTLKAIIENLRG